MSISIVIDLFMLVLVTSAGVQDLLQRRIANRLVGVFLLLALALHLAAGGFAAAWSYWFCGAATGMALFLPLYMLRGMAGGDVKLMAGVGAFAGPASALEIALATFCIGGVMALVIVLARGRVRDLLTNLLALLRPLYLRVAGMATAAEPLPAASVGNMPYGLAIALGTLLMLSLRQA
ncbi:MAG: prepilin peptidase [Pseudomonadota bacterium]